MTCSGHTRVQPLSRGLLSHRPKVFRVDARIRGRPWRTSTTSATTSTASATTASSSAGVVPGWGHFCRLDEKMVMSDVIVDVIR